MISRFHVANRLRSQGGFTLVEVVLAIGVVAFAFVGLFALLPSGLTLFGEAMDTSIGAQIAQQVVSEAQQADFDALLPASGTGTGGANMQFYVLPVRYFDDQGAELDATVPTQLVRAIYTVRTRGSLPGAPDPATATNGYFTSLPAAGTATRYEPRSATFLTVQVVKNPARKDVESFVDQDSYLITPAMAKTKHLALQTFSAVVSRNGYRRVSK